mmetsp:Transcript_14523/g.35349  ORF Transcript_14523/g.35349 Transcript_14523/m.35349 type:complete len:241 (-) Transcript_14523:1311-2033(-)
MPDVGLPHPALECRIDIDRDLVPRFRRHQRLVDRVGEVRDCHIHETELSAALCDKVLHALHSVRVRVGLLRQPHSLVQHLDDVVEAVVDLPRHHHHCLQRAVGHQEGIIVVALRAHAQQPKCAHEEKVLVTKVLAEPHRTDDLRNLVLGVPAVQVLHRRGVPGIDALCDVASKLSALLGEALEYHLHGLALMAAHHVTEDLGRVLHNVHRHAREEVNRDIVRSPRHDRVDVQPKAHIPPC